MDRDLPNVGGMIPAWNPDGMYLYGSTIAVWMHAVSAAPRFAFEAAVAQSLFSRMSRFGPTVPVAPAAASVWQAAHPAEANKALPAVADEPEPEVDELLELDADDVELGVLAAPGTPGWASVGPGTPTGAGPPGFCDCSHELNAAGVSTWTALRMNE